MLISIRCLLAAAAASVALTAGCATHSDRPPPMTQAQANQQLQHIANDPAMPETARAAAQQGVDEGQAQQMLGQGR